MESLSRAAPPRRAAGPMPASPDEVPLLRHGVDEPLRRRLAAVGLPRLLVLGPQDEPPGHGPHLLEDWVRTPYPATDAEARRANLLRRYCQRTQGLHVDAVGTLRAGGRAVPLSPVQVAIVVPLLGHLGAPVGRQVVAREYRAVAGPVAPRLGTALAALRHRLGGLGLRVHVLSPGGLLLDAPARGDVFHRSDLARTSSGNNYIGV
jgi:hypothetical protein